MDRRRFLKAGAAGLLLGPAARADMIINPYRYAASSTLLDGLVSWWSMNEASGTRVDSHGSNDLTDVNTVGSAAGKVGNAASIVLANGERFSGTAALPGSAFTFAAWVQPSAAVSTYHPFFIIDASGDLCDVFAFSGKYQFRTAGSTIGDSGVAYSTGTWAFVAFGHAGSTGFISVNNGSKVAVASSALTFAATEDFRIGGDFGLQQWGGLIDEAALWSRELTADEITELYNSGNGIGYPG